MPRTATGNPPGRPPGRKNAATVERERLHDAAKAKAFDGLTEDEIQRLTPRDIFRLVAQAAVRMKDLPLCLRAAADWAPYEHPKLASETLKIQNDDSNLSDEDLRRELAEIERCEALAKGGLH
jgi:hypothetical protein